jgi:menaquinone-dependent protoporphyrinogen oxidase
MQKKILVTFASKYGSTGEIAGLIGQELVQSGLAVDVLPVEEVGSLEAYSAVVLGSAVYAGSWRKDAVDFLEANVQVLAGMPVWIFSSGPTGSGDPQELLKGWRFPDAQQPLADRIQPQEIALFHGFLNTDKLNLAEKLLVKGIHAPTGDFRNWEAIRHWAGRIAVALQGEHAAPAEWKESA